MASPNNSNYCGGKAEGLKLLKEHKLPVPDFMVISNNEVHNVLETPEEMAKLYMKIKERFGCTKLAIRSSADKEDGQSKSYAGFFSTVLNVPIRKDKIYQAMKEVYESANRSVSNPIKMNIVIQIMVKPRISGVCFSDSFDERGQKICLISFVKGLANKLVDGRTTATNVFYKIKNNKICHSDYVVRGMLHRESCHLDKLVALVQKIRKEIAENSDIEWCIDEQGSPWIVQLRPITRKIHLSKETEKYIVASEGVVKGKVCYIDSSLPTGQLKNAINNFKSGNILVSDYTDTFFMPAINKAHAILTSEGDILSHSAITARELNIPCLVGIKNLSSKIKNGDEIFLDTYKNILKVNGVNISEETTDIDLTSMYDFSNISELTIKEDIFLFENIFGENILYHDSNCLPENIKRARQKLETKFGDKIQISTSNKYHWYFEWKNFCKFAIFRKYYYKALELVQNFKEDEIDHLYKEIIEKCMEIQKSKRSNNELERQEIIISLYFLLDMMLPMGLSIKHAYLEAFFLMSFSSLLSQEKVKKKKLEKVQKYLHCVIARKNEIFKKFMENGLLSYDFMQIRDTQIREKFQGKYPKYSPKMYQLFYEKYIEDVNADI